MNLTEVFESLGPDTITEFIRLGQEENLHIEFKTISNADLRDKNDKRNLATCLSGFANSSGGMIIWGVDARKNDLGVDCASRAVEVAPLKLFVSRLNELTGDAVSPLVNGIRHKVIETTTDRGFAATLVPESESGPHMAKLGDDRYYKRSGDSFYRMEHFDLEDMFGRRQKPKLLINYSVGQIKIDDADHEELNFKILNIGRAVAKYAGFLVSLENVEDASCTGHIVNLSGINAGRPIFGYTNSSDVIHPNGIAIFAGTIRYRRKNPGWAIGVEITSYCENVQTQKNLTELLPIQFPSSP